jgi:hypothetical protein
MDNQSKNLIYLIFDYIALIKWPLVNRHKWLWSYILLWFPHVVKPVIFIKTFTKIGVEVSNRRRQQEYASVEVLPFRQGEEEVRFSAGR